MKPVYISNIIFLVKTFTANNFLAKLNNRAFYPEVKKIILLCGLMAA